MKIETITLESYAYGGDAFGRLADPAGGSGGRAVFVPFALPGETVRARLIEEKRGFARAELVEVLQASPQRIAPRCPHFGTCGGCHYQHLPYPAQLQAKTAILRDQLERIGKLKNPPVQPAAPSPTAWGYRNHIQFHLTPAGRLGFMPAGNQPHAQAIPIQECHLPEAPIQALWPQLDIDAILGLERVAIRLGAAEELMVVLESSDPQPVELEVDLPLSVVHAGPGGVLVLAGEDHLLIEVAGRSFRVSPESFFQVHSAMAAQMVQHLLENLPLMPGATVVDAYCGVGLFSAFLAGRAGRLIGIESHPAACEDFVINLDEFDHVELYEATVEDALPALGVQPDLLVADPPRAGLGRHTLAAILALKPGTIAYVSCDPATLARDAGALVQGGYHLRQITPFDLFPQTFHVESISFFELRY